MRDRLILTLVSMTVSMLLVFGVVRAYSTAELVHEQQEALVQQSADLAALALAAHGSDTSPVAPSLLGSLAREEQLVTYIDSAGARITGGDAAPGSDDIHVTRDVEGGGTVTVTQSGSVSSDMVSEALLPLVLFGLVLVLIAAVVGSMLARRFAHPFRRLADDAIRIGNGDFDVDVHRSSIREAADLGDALRRAATQLDTLVRRERELAVVASHELRTPITALRLSLEDLTLWPQTPPEVTEELQHSLAEVDRLSSVVTTLLERSDDGHLGTSVDVDLRDIAAEAIKRWSGKAHALGRKVVLVPSGPAVAHIVHATVDRVVDILIENALAHGAGTITIDIVAHDSHLGIRVADEGNRTIDTGIVHVSPAGRDANLTHAATQAESLGGFVVVGDVRTTRVLLALPRPDAS